MIKSETRRQTARFSLSLCCCPPYLSTTRRPTLTRFGHIDEAAIENLGLVTRLVDMIRVDKDGADGSQGTESASKGLAQYFPYFLWCLRDFNLDLKGKPSE